MTKAALPAWLAELKLLSWELRRFHHAMGHARAEARPVRNQVERWRGPYQDREGASLADLAREVVQASAIAGRITGAQWETLVDMHQKIEEMGVKCEAIIDCVASFPEVVAKLESQGVSLLRAFDARRSSMHEASDRLGTKLQGRAREEFYETMACADRNGTTTTIIIGDDGNLRVEQQTGAWMRAGSGAA